MRSSLFAGALLAGLVAAAPAPQDIDFELADSVPNPVYTTTLSTVSYDPTSILESAMPQITSQASNDTDAASTDAAPQRRAASTSCAPQPTGAGPVPSPDTASAFAILPAFSSAAVNAPVPSGYSQSFSNLNASNNAYGYMGYMAMSSYNVTACANKCNKINGCMAFNVFFERDPSVDPGTGGASSGCANPPSTTNIKCVWWGGPVTADNALNQGQWRNQFQVVIAGSNGYVNNTLATPAGYTTPEDLGNAAINAPYDQYGFDSSMGAAIFNSGPFDLQLCADACSKKSAYNLAHPPTDGSPVKTCQFFNTYILYINSTANLQGQYCAMYSESWPKSYATNTGQYRGYDHYLIEYSYSVSNVTNPGAAAALPAVYQASKDISYSTLQPFCSSYLGYTTTATTTVTATPSPLAKRTTSAGMPPVLTKYPSAILSSACSLQATPATTTVTVTPTPTPVPGNNATCAGVSTGATFAIQASYNDKYGFFYNQVLRFQGTLPSDGQAFSLDTNGYLNAVGGSNQGWQALQGGTTYSQPVYFDTAADIAQASDYVRVVCTLDPSTCALACSDQGNTVYGHGIPTKYNPVQDVWYLGASASQFASEQSATPFDYVYAVGVSV